LRVAIIVGHSPKSQGAYGNEGVSEYMFNDNLIRNMKSLGYFDECQHELYFLSRDSNINGYTNQMIDLHKHIDSLDCEVSIELHFNSFNNEKVHGHEVLYCSQKGKNIAEIMNHSLDEFLPTSNRGTKKVSLYPYPLPDDRGAGFCCRGNSYAIILEPFFGAHQTDFIYGGMNRLPLMTAIANGIAELKTQR